MGINLSILPHQKECVNRVSNVFKSVDMIITNEFSANPIFEKSNINIKRNIAKIQDGENSIASIPKEFRTSTPDEFGIDIKMETGTGKTYCYTQIMYELNKLYGFHKFIILVPTTPIKEGTH